MPVKQFRLNYRNGQVSNTLTLTDARNLRDRTQGYTFIQKQYTDTDSGDIFWFACKDDGAFIIENGGYLISPK